MYWEHDSVDRRELSFAPDGALFKAGAAPLGCVNHALSDDMTASAIRD
jgi:hypothetical protein